MLRLTGLLLKTEHQSTGMPRRFIYFPMYSTIKNLPLLYQGLGYCVFLLPLLLNLYNMMPFNVDFCHRYGSKRTTLEREITRIIIV